MTVTSNTAKTRKRLSTILASNSEPIVLDGALATYLETLGADISGALWSAHLLTTHPSLIKQTHLDYFHSGATIVITASYQASIAGLTKHLSITPPQARDVIAKSVRLAQEARDEYLAAASQMSAGVEEDGEAKQELLIAGSVGPYGAYLADGSEYTGAYELGMDAMKDFHRGRIDALIAADSDFLAIETIPSLVETKALIDLLDEEFPDAEAWFSFTLAPSDGGSDAVRIADGTPMADVLALLERSERVVAVGVNCVAAEAARPALEEMAKCTNKALVVYPNSGEVWDAEGRNWGGERTGGEGLVERTKGLRKAGARIVGGCCRSTPDDIRIVAETFRKGE